MGYLVFIIVLAVVAVLVLANLKKFASLTENLKVFYGEVAYEMGKVIWPKREEVINSTILVGVMAVVLTVIVMCVDRIIGLLVQYVF